MSERLASERPRSNSKNGGGLEIETRLIEAMRLSAMGGGIQPISRRRHVSEATVYGEADGRIKGPWKHALDWLLGAEEGKTKDPYAPLRVLAEAVGFGLEVLTSDKDVSREGIRQRGLVACMETSEAAIVCADDTRSDAEVEEELREAEEAVEILRATWKARKTNVRNLRSAS